MTLDALNASLLNWALGLVSTVIIGVIGSLIWMRVEISKILEWRKNFMEEYRLMVDSLEEPDDTKNP